MGARRCGLVALVVVAAACSSSSGHVAAGANGAVGNAPAGLVAQGTGVQTVRADLAFVVVEPSSGDSFNSSVGAMTAAQRRQVTAKVGALGIDAAAVSFDDGDPASGSPGTTVRVEIPVTGRGRLARRVAAAIAEVSGGAPTSGLRFAVSDCTAAITSARSAALADAARAAHDLARAAHVSLGSVRAVTGGTANAGASAASVLDPFAAAPCGRSSVATPASVLSYGPGSRLLPLDAEPEVDLTYDVAVEYDLGTTAARTITASGSGDVDAPADAADIIIGPSTNVLDDAPHAISAEQRGEIVSSLRALGVAAHDVEIETKSGDALAYVRVHVTPAVEAAKGHRIADAVNRVLGVDPTSTEPTAGVVFTSSSCATLTARAREQSLRDATRALDALARAARVRLGAVVGLQESAATSILGTSIASLQGPGDACRPSFDRLAAAGVDGAPLSIALGDSFNALVPLGAQPRVEVHVGVSETRAVAG